MQNKIHYPIKFKNKQMRRTSTNQEPKLPFGANKTIQKTEKIEDKRDESKKYSNSLKSLDKFNFMTNHKISTNLNFVLLGTTGASFTLLALKRYRLGKILKSLGIDKLPVSLKGRLIKVADKATKDALTGLFNNAYLKANIVKDFNTAVKKKQNLGVAMLDMDNFKGINDVFNHSTGDLFLKRISLHINSVVKKYNAKGFRYGGEEFVITVKDKNANNLKQVIEEIADLIKEDKEIQSYLPKFKEKTKADIKFLSKAKKQLDSSIFRSLRSREKVITTKPKKVKKAIISIIEEHIEKYNPADNKILKEIIEKFKKAKQKELSGLLSINTKFGETTLGEELNNLYIKYKNLLNDLLKWDSHVEQHGKFTLSSGVVDLNSADDIREGIHLVKIADAALKSAKENGKNTVRIANKEIIKNTV